MGAGEALATIGVFGMIILCVNLSCFYVWFLYYFFKWTGKNLGGVIFVGLPVTICSFPLSILALLLLFHDNHKEKIKLKSNEGK